MANKWCFRLLEHRNFNTNYKNLSVDTKKNFKNKIVRYNLKFRYMENIK